LLDEYTEAASGFWGGSSMTVVSWVLENPNSILENFDAWFAFECRRQGLAEFDPDDFPMFPPLFPFVTWSITT
jgi:hypothetical protein